MHITNKSTQGITFFGLMILAIVIILVLIMGFRIAPPYMQYYAIQKTLNSMAKEPETKTSSEQVLRKTFNKRLHINNIRGVKPDLLEVERKGKKRYLSVNYEVRMHLMGNIDGVLKFEKQVKIE